MRGTAVAVLAFFACSAAFCAATPAMAVSGAPETAGSAVEAVSLRSIAGWLKASGSTAPREGMETSARCSPPEVQW